MTDPTTVSLEGTPFSLEVYCEHTPGTTEVRLFGWLNQTDGNGDPYPPRSVYQSVIRDVEATFPGVDWVIAKDRGICRFVGSVTLATNVSAALTAIKETIEVVEKQVKELQDGKLSLEEGLKTGIVVAALEVAKAPMSPITDPE